MTTSAQAQGARPVDAPERARLREIVTNTQDLPAMPHVASKVLDLSSDPHRSARRQLRDLLESEMEIFV